MKHKQPILYLLGIFMLILWGCKKDDNSNLGERYYYYGAGEKIYINKVNTKLVVKYEDNETAKKSTSHIASITQGSEFLWHDEATVVITLNENAVKNIISVLTKDKGVLMVNPVYISSSSSDSGSEMFYTDEFLVQFKPTVSPAEIKKINDRYGVRITKETDIYTLLTVPRLADALKIANKYQESGLVIYSHPNFYAKISFGSTAEYLPKETF